MTGMKLMEARNARRPHLTQAELGALVGATGKVIGNIERGYRRLDTDMAKRIARVLNVSPEYFSDAPVETIAPGSELGKHLSTATMTGGLIPMKSPVPSIASELEDVILKRVPVPAFFSGPRCTLRELTVTLDDAGLVAGDLLAIDEGAAPVPGRLSCCRSDGNHLKIRLARRAGSEIIFVDPVTRLSGGAWTHLGLIIGYARDFDARTLRGVYRHEPDGLTPV